MSTTLAELYDFQTPIEATIKAVLHSVTGANCVTSQETTVKDSPRIEIEYDKGESMGMKYPHAGAFYDFLYRGRLVVRIISNRRKDGSTASHRVFRGGVEATLIPGTGYFTTFNLPFHQLADLRLTSAPFTIDEANAYDITELQYNSVCAIRTEAWTQLV